jgi:hypothetical protein
MLIDIGIPGALIDTSYLDSRTEEQRQYDLQRLQQAVWAIAEEVDWEDAEQVG